MKGGSATTAVARSIAPLVLGVMFVGGWEFAVRYYDTPSYILPAPSLVIETIGDDWESLSSAWLVTLRTMLVALAAAVLGGVLLAALFATSRVLELSLFPYAVVLQVTPLVALAPLLLIWIERTSLVMYLCAWIVAFFPILANTVVGLRSVDSGRRDLFELYGASRWQRLLLLEVPTALPYFLTGLRVAVNLSLVGAVVAEFVTGAAAESPGLASVVFEGQYRTDMQRTFAALLLISLTGVALYFATYALSWLILRRWHESAAPARV